MLLQKIQNELNEAIKNKKELKVSTLRMLSAALKNKEIAKRKGGKAELTDDDVIEVIGREVKQRNDAISEYEKGGRSELAEKERQEKIFLQKYLPEQLSEAEILKAIQETIKELGEVDASKFGQVMRTVMSKLKGKTDGKVVSQLTKELLDKK